MITKLGVITKPQGIKGEFRLKSYIPVALIKDIDTIVFNNTEHKVEKVTLREGFVIIKVNDVLDRNQVELLRNVDVFFEDNSNHDLQEGEYFVDDIIGAKLLNKDGVELGQIVTIDNYGGADIYTVKSAAQEFMFPFARNVIKRVDIDKKVVVVDENILNEIKSE